MKDTVKKFIHCSFDRYKETELKLEKLAAKGLLLEKCGPFLWTFRKSEPQNVTYTVTYFSEGSIFNPDISYQQQRYIDKAKATGWHHVTELNQLQIFCNHSDNPIPFEPNEKEHFDNIKKSMNKSYLPSILIMILLFMFHLYIFFDSFRFDPIVFLSDPMRLILLSISVTGLIYNLYSLLAYFIWCKRSERSIARGGGCVQNTNIVYRMIEIIFISCMLASLVCLFCYLALEESWLSIVLSIARIPICILIFWGSIKCLKKDKTSATVNKVISFTVLIIANFAYSACIALLTVQFGFTISDDSNDRTVDWPIASTNSSEYILHSDDMPLTCEDLYGTIDYDYYSYEKESDSTFFLAKSSCRQNALPAKDAPPEITYDIIEPQFDFVYYLAKNHLLDAPPWRDNMSFATIDNTMFDTKEAYQCCYNNTPTSEYILLFEHKIIALNMEKPPTTKQISIIKEKLLT